MNKQSIILTLFFLITILGMQTAVAEERVYNIGKSGGFPPL